MIFYSGQSGIKELQSMMSIFTLAWADENESHYQAYNDLLNWCLRKDNLRWRNSKYKELDFDKKQI